jgi:hypothetical protein
MCLDDLENATERVDRLEFCEAQVEKSPEFAKSSVKFSSLVCTETKYGNYSNFVLVSVERSLFSPTLYLELSILFALFVWEGDPVGNFIFPMRVESPLYC